MFELSDPDRGLLEQTYALRFRLKFACLKLLWFSSCWNYVLLCQKWPTTILGIKRGIFLDCSALRGHKMQQDWEFDIQLVVLVIEKMNPALLRE